MANARISDGDLVYVRKQDDVDSRDIAVVMVNGEDATIKRVIKMDDGVILQPESSNSAHLPLLFRRSDDFKIIGKVMHVKFKV
jgi:repressor LexA